MRRLITLISASRNRIIVIRRELPRTENADWVRKPYRTKHRRILLSVSPGPVTRSAEEFIRRGDSNRKLRCRPTGGGRYYVDARHGSKGREERPERLFRSHRSPGCQKWKSWITIVLTGGVLWSVAR